MATIIGLNPLSFIPVQVLQNNKRHRSEVCYMKGQEDKFYIRKTYEYQTLYDIDNVIDKIQDEFTRSLNLSQQKDFPNNLTEYLGYYCDKKEIMIVRSFLVGEKLQSICSKTHSLHALKIFSYAQQLLKSIKFVYENGFESHNTHYDNVFIKDDIAYLSDWGMPELYLAMNRMGHARKDSAVFNDPYLFRTGLYAGFESEIYSVGLIVFSLVTNKTYNIRRFPPVDILPYYQPHKGLIMQMINTEPEKRCNMSQIDAYTRALNLNM